MARIGVVILLLVVAACGPALSETHKKKPSSDNLLRFLMVPDQEPDSQQVVYCDKTHFCPSMNTCCRQRYGDWGCCPKPKAVCCQDGVHCCPNGYRCILSTNKCYRGNDDVIPMLEKTPALEEGINQDDGQDKLTARFDVTKQRIDQGQDGAQKNQVAKFDVLHNTQDGAQNKVKAEMDASKQGIDKGQGTQTTVTKMDAKLSIDNTQDGVQKTPLPRFEVAASMMQDSIPDRVYCNGSHFCPDSYTCCYNRHGSWSCCPGLHATCCPDGVHCCPPFHHCDSIGRRCYRREGPSLAWSKLRPLIGGH